MQISPHGSVLLKVTGTFSWAKGATYQAEWPDNLRAGAAKYVVCRECDGGYAVSLPGTRELRNDGSSLDFTHIVVSGSGRYWVTTYGIRSVSAGEHIAMRINRGRLVQILIHGAGARSTATPVQLNRGSNSITFTPVDASDVTIDRLMLHRERIVSSCVGKAWANCAASSPDVYRGFDNTITLLPVDLLNLHLRAVGL